MIIKLISLVIITLFLLSGQSYSEDQFLFPEKKPSIFKSADNTEKTDLNKGLPQKKTNNSKRRKYWKGKNSKTKRGKREKRK